MKDAKSFADVLDSVLSEWRKFFAFLGLVVVCMVLLGGAVLLTVDLMPKETESLEVHVPGGGALSIKTRKNNKSQYLTVVQPQGWQPTEILVKKGQRLGFKAGGKVCVDLDGLVKKADQLTKLEDAYTKQYHIDKNSQDPKQRPEKYYTEKEVVALNLDRIWAGPAGLDSRPDTSFAGRSSFRLLNNQKLGALVAAIEPQGRLPKPGDVFLIGESADQQATADGVLWFNVNDVTDKGNDNRPDDSENRLFYFDNVGFFWVQVILED